MKQIFIKVDGAKWKVLFKKPTPSDYIGIEEDDIGLCVSEEKKIFVTPNPDMVLGTAIHEVLHAVFPQLNEDAIIAGEEALIQLLDKFPKELLNES
jgi:hypothetical protein